MVRKCLWFNDLGDERFREVLIGDPCCITSDRALVGIGKCLPDNGGSAQEWNSRDDAQIPEGATGACSRSCLKSQPTCCRLRPHGISRHIEPRVCELN